MVISGQRTCVLTIIACTLCSPLKAGKPALATIDMAKAFESYHLTHAERNRVQEARKALLRDPRPETLKLLQVELGDLKGRIQDPGGEEKQRQQDYQRFLVKHHEYSTLKSEHERDRSAKLKILNESMVVVTRKLLNDIRTVVRKIAREEGFDHVFEIGGKTSSQLPSLIYIRDATDLTVRVIEELNRKEGGEPVESSPDP